MKRRSAEAKLLLRSPSAGIIHGEEEDVEREEEEERQSSDSDVEYDSA